MRYKKVDVFVTSPKRVTTYHIDSESGFLLQIAGSKEISLFRYDDREVLPEEEIEQFWTVDRNAPRYRPHLQHHADQLTLEPGMGGAYSNQCPALGPKWKQYIYFG